MNRQEFITYIKSPEKLNSQTTGTLQLLAKEYPYCQTIDILYALNLYKENNIKYTDQLKIAAAYAADRKLLRHQIDTLKSERGIIKPTDQKSLSLIEKANKAKAIIDEPKEENLIELINHLKEEVTSFIIQTNYKNNKSESISSFSKLAHQLEDILKESEDSIQQKPKDKQSILSEYSLDHIEEVETDTDSNIKNLELIDKFIENEPRISPVPQTDFYDPVDHANQSLVDNEDIVSETLATVYYQQGNLSKAIKIYKKLCLVNPEKSTYFAAQIEKIQKEIK